MEDEVAAGPTHAAERARARPPTASADLAAVIAVILLTACCVGVGLGTGYRTVDVDELVFRRTLVSMQHGESYYVAMRRALVQKEGAPPTQLRSIRPPTLFLVLARFPPATWRWLVGLAYLATLLLAWRIGRGFGPWGGLGAVVGAGLWMLGAAPLLFLHPELWGVPFLLAGGLSLRNARWGLAAGLLGAAVLLRETYAVAFAAGFLWSERRRPWIIASGVILALGALHASLAQVALASQGREAAFGQSGLGVHYVLSAISPADRPFAWTIGVIGGLLGFLGLVANWADDRCARLFLVNAAVLIPATVLVGREYWGLTFGVALVVYAPAGVIRIRELRAV